MEQSMANVFVRLSVLMDRGQLHEEALQSGREAGEQFSESFKENLKSLAVGFIGFETAREGIKEIIEGAGQLAEATDRAKVAAENAGLSWSVVSTQLKQAEQDGVALGFTVQSMADVYGTLVTRTQDTDKAQRELSASEDLARFKHISLADAADRINRAFLGQTRALRDLGIQIPENASAAEKLAAIQEFSNRIHGQAEEYTRSLTGRVDQLKAKFGEEAATIGGHVNPALAGLTKGMTEHMGTILSVGATVGGLYASYRLIDAIVPAVTMAQAKYADVRDRLTGSAARAALAEKEEAAAQATAATRRAEANVAIQRNELATMRAAEAKALEAAATDKSTAAETALAAARGRSVLAAQEVAAAERVVSTAREAEVAATGAARGATGWTAALGGLKAGLGTAVLAMVAFQLVSAGLSHSAALSAEGTKALAGSLANLDAQAMMSDKTLKHFDYDITAFGTGTMEKVGTGIGSVVESLTGLGGVMDDSVEHARQRMHDIDEGLTALQNSGDPAKVRQAAAAYDLLLQRTKQQGGNINDLKNALPDYALALSNATEETNRAAISTEQMTDAAGRLGLSLEDVQVQIANGGNLEDVTRSVIGYQNAIQSAKDHEEQLAEAVDSTHDSLVEAQNKVVEAQSAYHDSLDRQADDVQSITDAQRALTKARQEAAANIENLRLQTERLSAAEGTASDKLEHSRRALAAAQRLDPHSLQYQEILHSFQGAQADYDEAVNSSAKNRADLSAAERAGINGSDQVIAAKKALRSAETQYQKDQAASVKAYQAIGKAQQDQTKAQVAYDKAVSRNTDTLDLSTQAGRDNVTAMLNIKDAYEKSHPSSHTEYSDLMNIYTALGLTNVEAGEFLTNLGAINAAQGGTGIAPGGSASGPKGQVVETITVNRTKAPPTGLPAGGFWINDNEYHFKYNGQWLTWIRGTGVTAPWPATTPAELLGVPTHALGGNLSEGLNLVGELGPEYVLKTGSRVQVFPHGETPPTGGGQGSGGVHLHLTNVQMNDPVDVDTIVQKLQFAARRWT